jgi:hypothetical protein
MEADVSARQISAASLPDRQEILSSRCDGGFTRLLISVAFACRLARQIDHRSRR